MRSEALLYRDFPTIENAEQLLQYMEDRREGHSTRSNRYCHYTSISAIDGILANNVFYIRSLMSFNDLLECATVGEDNASRMFALCFSTGTNENLPLWYLYSGLDGKGARIELTYSQLEKLIRRGNYYLINEGEHPNVSQLVKECRNDEHKVTVSIDQNHEADFDCRMLDVLYWHKDSDTKNVIKYNNLRNLGGLNDKEVEKYKSNTLGFNKSAIWYYEKEFRVLFAPRPHMVEKMQKDTKYALLLEFPKEVRKTFKLRFAPETKSIQEILNGYSSICEFVEENAKCFRKSEHAGNIEMQLYKKCKQYLNCKCRDCKQMRSCEKTTFEAATELKTTNSSCKERK